MKDNIKIISGILIILMILVLNINVTNAGVSELDNRKYYNENTKTLTVTNSVIGIPTNTIATVELLTPKSIKVFPR